MKGVWFLIERPEVLEPSEAVRGSAVEIGKGSSGFFCGIRGSSKLIASGS